MADETVLIIEDAPAMLRVLKDNFEFEGYKVFTAADGEEGLDTAVSLNPNIIILDIMLPKINGYEICRLLRKNKIESTIIMLTAKGQESDVILGLNLGADDYMTKPFSIKELLARANAFLRRCRETPQNVRRFGDFELDIDSHTFKRDNRNIKLTPKEFKLLCYFTSRAGRVLTRDDILNSVWGHDIFVTPRSVDRCINTLRKKIEKDQNDPIFIKTVREIGYRFDNG